MRYKRLGSTGLFVSEFCIGTMTFNGAAARHRLMHTGMSGEHKIMARGAR
ncbi:hypothetical protein ALO97_03710 [Pseudomonas syringae pv. tagetis]|nr:hypothetical protein ALO97_03710 [Pseudomonas syringae pv. tagetis]